MDGIYKDRLLYDNKGDHIYWSVNGYRFAKFDYNLTPVQRFKFDYEIPIDWKFYDFKTEVQNALIKIYQTHKKTLAVCVSGADSEIIVREAVNLSIPCKIYFLNFWDANSNIRKTVEALAKELRVELNVVTLSEKECFENVILKSFETMQTIRSSYLCMPYLFDRIPQNEFIIVGEGDLAKGHPHFGRCVKHFGSKGIPILATEILYRIWAQEHGRFGEYYFHSSTPGLILSAYNNPQIYREHPYIYTGRMLKSFWPNLTFQDKTDNWEFMQDKLKLLIDTLLQMSERKEQIVWAFVPNKALYRK